MAVFSPCAFALACPITSNTVHTYSWEKIYRYILLGIYNIYMLYSFVFLNLNRQPKVRTIFYLYSVVYDSAYILGPDIFILTKRSYIFILSD